MVLGVVTKAVEGRWEDARRAAREAQGATAQERAYAVAGGYMRQLTLIGAAAGGTAAVPGIGTIAALSATTAEVAAFAYRATEMILAIGAAHGHTGADAEERTAWVLAILTHGRKAAAEYGEIAMALGAGVTLEAARAGDRAWFPTINRYLARKFVTRWGARRGAAALGKALPFGIGAAFGAGTNYAVARRIALAADRFFATLAPRPVNLAELPPPQPLPPPPALAPALAPAAARPATT
jgi:hypothetical protein